MEKTKCTFCADLDDLGKEYPDEPHHGAQLICDECNAEYYEEWGGTRWNYNEQAQFNHPELKKI